MNEQQVTQLLEHQRVGMRDEMVSMSSQAQDEQNQVISAAQAALDAERQQNQQMQQTIRVM